MPAPIQQFRARVCQDCLQFSEGFSEHERGRAYSAEHPPLSRLVDPGDHFTISAVCDEDGNPLHGFDRSGCEGCGCPLGDDLADVEVAVFARGAEPLSEA